MSSNPLSFWWELARLPLSGDVDQRFLGSFLSPSLTVNYGGNAEIERRVVSDVASFGRQIGWLSEIVDRLADGERPPEDALRKLREAMEQIAAIKEQMRQSAQIEAADAVDRFAKQDPEALREFLQRRLEDLAQARPPAKGRSRRR
jgi:exonuclease VII small subunit